MLFCTVACCAVLLIPSCRRHPALPNSLFEIRVYAVREEGFGYALYQGARKIIDQPNIPGVRGVAPFRSREEAESIAQLVSRKLQAHQFPPTVTIDELDSLRIHYR